MYSTIGKSFYKLFLKHWPYFSALGVDVTFYVPIISAIILNSNLSKKLKDVLISPNKNKALLKHWSRKPTNKERHPANKLM